MHEAIILIRMIPTPSYRKNRQ